MRGGNCDDNRRQNNSAENNDSDGARAAPDRRVLAHIDVGHDLAVTTEWQIEPHRVSPGFVGRGW